MNTRTIQNKNVFLVYLFAFLSCGIYSTIWTIQSKRDMNALGANIPTSWLMLVPFANIYFLYKYCEGFSNEVKKDNSPILWFAVSIFAGPLLPFFVQSELNKNTTVPTTPVDGQTNIKIAA